MAPREEREGESGGEVVYTLSGWSEGESFLTALGTAWTRVSCRLAGTAEAAWSGFFFILLWNLLSSQCL